MDISIFKPGRPILFEDAFRYDTSGWSAEIKGFIYLLEKIGHKVNIISETDNEDYKFEMKPELIFVFNGLFSDQTYATLRSYDCPKVMCVTDLSLLWERDIGDILAVIGQGPSYIKLSNGSTLDTHYPFHAMLCMKYERKERKKLHRYVFGGNERNRLKKIMEYVYRPGCIWFGKSAFIGFRNKIPFDEMQKTLEQTKYSIVIADKEYDEVGFCTQRYFELICNDVIAFIDNDYDNKSMLVNQTDYRRVEDYIDLYDKMRFLDEDKNMYEEILDEQRKQIKSFSEEKMIERTEILMSHLKYKMEMKL